MKIALLISGLLIFTNSFAQFEPPELLFREDWTQPPPFETVSQRDVMNPLLIQALYGPGQDSIKKRHHYTDKDPYYIFTGFCLGNWALTLSHKNILADLTGNAVIRCRMMNSGLRQLHIILKLENGTWLVSDLSEGASATWQVHDFVIKDIKWYLLNIKTVIEGDLAVNPVLNRVTEIGFTDLMNGGLSAACSRIDWIEVYAGAVKR
jgi:hypothetical protein